jgi:response regulator RpfG family c-di-GMP phosphodiesterase
MNETDSKILFVDDDPNVLSAMQRTLRKRFVIEVASGGNEAIEILKAKGPFAVIVADMTMPVMNGVELLEAVSVLSPDTVRIMLTGNADQHTAAEAVNRGAIFRFLAKPCVPEILLAALDTALKQYELVVTEKALLSKTLNGSLQVLTDILAMLDAEAFGKAQVRRTVVREIAIKMGIASTWDLETAALLAEIGIVTLPPVVREKLRTRQSLNPNERQLVERVPEFSSRLLSAIPRLETVAQAVLYQNKNFDGSGFPADNICKGEIPTGGRILRVVGDVVKMHGRGMPVSDVVEVLKAGPERYDQAIVREIPACSSALQTKTKNNGAGMRSVPLAELAPGYVLLSDITTVDGTVILCVGTTLNATQLQRLRNFASLNPVVEPIAVDIPPATQWGSRQYAGPIAAV